MKKNLIYSYFAASLIIIIFSCQRELSFEEGKASVGSLKKDIIGDCLPITVSGTFIVGRNVSDTNYIEVEVNITSPGTYLIRTDTINGYSFKGTGSFSNTGSYHVKLTGLGIPIAQGSNDFAVIYDTSTCHTVVNVLPAIDTSQPAVFTLQGAPNACMNDTVTGSYVKDVSLDTASKVNIGIIVATPGTYAISTNTVNGYSFSGFGTLSTTGLQTISLTASGTPVNAGTNVFTVTAGPSACTFSITVLTAITVANNDHFPLTDNSHWTYDELFHPGDSLTKKIIDTISMNGNLYKIMGEQPMFGFPVQYFFRKAGSDYFEYASVDKYTNTFQYSPQQNADIPFLKENLTTGDNWESAEYTGTATFGQVIILKYKFLCIDANATVIINGNAFTNIYKIVMQPQIRSLSDMFGYTGEIYNYYYAKGIGIVYFKRTRDGFTLSELQIRDWLVN
jgi:hypothetical protein